MLVEQLLLLARRLELGEFGLLAHDLLGRLGLGERPGLGRAGLGSCGLRLGFRPAQCDVSLGVDLDLLGLGFADCRLLVRPRFGHTRVTLAASRLLLADELHVPGLVPDRLDGERVDLEAGRGEVALGRVLDGLLELHAIEVQLLDGQRADDGPEGSLQHVLDDRVDLLLLGVEESFGGVANRLVIGTDLEGGDALDSDLDALPGYGVAELDVDLARGEHDAAHLVDQR